MRRLDAIFIPVGGMKAKSVSIQKTRSDDMIAFLRPASTSARTLAGWVDRSSVDADDIHPAEALFVSLNGEGSHTYAYVSPFEFICNQDVSVLTPIAEMSLREKIWYAKCITVNRFRFSYGRKPNGDRLKALLLPDYPENWDLTIPELAWISAKDDARSQARPA